MTKLLEHKSENLISRFRKCGIFRLDKQQLLEWLPREDLNVDVIGDAFIQHMVQRRDGCGAKSQMMRRKKLNVKCSSRQEPEDVETTAGHTTPSCSEAPSRKRGRPKKITVSSSDTSSCTDDLSIHDDSAEDDGSNFEDSNVRK
jgi:hypothetical protein